MLNPRALLADDHPLFREALGAAIHRLRPSTVIDYVETLDGVKQALKRNPDYELVFLDLKLPDCDGLTGLLTLRAEFPHSPVVVISATEDASTVSSVVTIGALGFIPKSAPLSMISKALQAILEGDVWTPEHIVLSAPTNAAIAMASLSPAQTRLLPPLARGLSNKDIAEELGVTEATVKAHLTAAFRKLGVGSRTQALLLVEAELRRSPNLSA
jgi:DNA-binding NarL/FixJ family response regulator